MIDPAELERELAEGMREELGEPQVVVAEFGRGFIRGWREVDCVLSSHGLCEQIVHPDAMRGVGV